MTNVQGAETYTSNVLHLTPAGLWRRFFVYLIDVTPFTVFVAVIGWVFFGFDEAVQNRLENRDDLDSAIEFFRQRNRLRDIATFLWFLYGAVFEGFHPNATLGKRLLGIRVVRRVGSDFGYRTSFTRNFSKIVSIVPCGLGLIWAAFDKNRQCWHDKIASTIVVTTRGIS